MPIRKMEKKWLLGILRQTHTKLCLKNTNSLSSNWISWSSISVNSKFIDFYLIAKVDLQQHILGYKSTNVLHSKINV